MAEDDSEKIGLISVTEYGSVSTTSILPRVEETTEEGNIEDPPSSIFRRSRVMSSRQSVRGNIWKSIRSIDSTSQRDYEAHLRMVPSLLVDNVRLFCNSNLDSPKPGVFYMQEDCFYKEGNPEYALSVNHDIYLQMMKEVNDANSIPLSLYFCCHGGDGAHSGVAHGDFVDIKVAILILFVLFTIFLFLVFDLPWPDNDDDFFG